MNESRQVEPGHFLRSFFVVALHYVILFFGLLMSILVIAKLRFPEVLRLWTLKEDQRDEFWNAWENSPELLFPTEFCLWLVVAAALLSVFIGFQVAFWAPFSKAGHGIFLAIISIVTYLQISLTQSQIPKGMMMAMLVISPACIVWASHVGERWFSRRIDSAEESPANE